MVLDGSAEKSVELVAEATFGTFPTDPTMLGIGGYPVKVTNKKTVQIETFPYLKEVAGTNRSQSTKVAKVGEAYAVNIDMRPTGWDMWGYLLGGTPAAPAISDTVAKLSMANKVGSAEYEKFTGGIVQKIECNIEPDKAADQSVDLLFVDSDGITGADYIGAGAHAAVASGSPLDAPGVTAVTYDSAALSAANAKLEYIKMAGEYPVNPVRDITASWASRIGGWARGQRNISLELGLTLDSMTTLQTDMFDGAAHTFEFTALGQTLTFSNIIWGGDWEQDLDPDDVIMMPLKSSNVDLVFS
ncbi:MAG: hypothetical protein KAS66_08175 [Candidatus Omnitrophica bacterium]|nr:hypothetical protein [Candidatus Omnitrophota bacterium]